MARRLLAALTALALLTGAAAEDPESLNLGRMTRGYSYFNHPGADVAVHDADVAACLAEALEVRSVQESMRIGAPGLIGALIADAQADAANRGVVSASLENCMVVRGWRVVLVDEAEGLALSVLPATELSDRLAPWIGAEQPHGTIARVWNNDAALGAVNHFSLHAQHTKNGQLSLLSISQTVGAAIKADKPDASRSPFPGRVNLDPQWIGGSLNLKKLDAAPPGSALLVVNLKGLSLRQGNGFTLSRSGADGEAWPSQTDRGTDLIYAGWALISGGGGKDGKFKAFAVPPGRWRISGMYHGAITLNFCLGAPAFEAKAGEVVFLGQLDLKQDVLKPDLDLEPVKAWLAGTSAAGKVRPADYVNGVRGPCSPGNAIYALEFEGMPFEEGYAMGSRSPFLKP